MGERVFMIDNLNMIENYYLNTIIKILNNGSKFVPCFHYNDYSIFRDLLYNFDTNFSIINRSILFNLNKSANKSKTKNTSQPPLDKTPIPIIQTQTNMSITYTQICTDLNCFYEKIKEIKNPDSYYVHKNSIDFKFNFYYELTKQKFNYKRNLNSNEMIYLYKFMREKPFKVAECDKNIGISILSHDIYDKLCYEHLNDNNTYTLLDNDPLELTNFSLLQMVTELLTINAISENLFNKLQVKNSNLGKFRILLKLHKEKLKSRPIINCSNHPTSNLCLLVDVILQPFVRACDSFIQDSQNLIQKTKDFRFITDSLLYSADFESLYTNINLDHALFVITDYLSTRFKSNEIKIEAFHRILKFIFENNVFIFKDRYYKQKSGIAMGSKCGPSIANIYISILENNFITIHKPLLYVRFIDDIFIITLQNFNIELLQTFFGYLKLNIASGKRVNFLDLIISLSSIDGKLLFSIYIKETQTFSYLITSSNHPKFIFNNIPKSLFIRIRRICSFYYDYLYYARLLIKHLTLRSYEISKLRECARMVGDLDRANVIPYKNKTKLLGITSTKYYNNINYGNK
jgi:hypothetical protein